MLSNYFKITWRNFTKNKIFSAINILGLAIGLTGFLLMVLYLESEWKYDRFHTNGARIYRVADSKKTPEATLSNASSAAPVAPALVADFPEVQAAVRLLPAEMLMQHAEKIFQERAGFFADPGFFQVFSFPLLEGDAATALKEPGSIVLTAAMAQKYYGDISPIGQSITADKKVYRITGVAQNVLAESHFAFDFLISMATAQQQDSGQDWLFTNWYSDQFYTYILLPENYDARSMGTKLAAFDQRHDEAGDNTVHSYTLEKLTDIYLHSDRDNQIGKTGSVANLYIFSMVAFFILLIACVNFINLSTARVSARAKEVGIKKVSGASRWQLALQFLTESFTTTAICLVLAGLAVQQLLPLFNRFSGKELSADFFEPLHLSVLFGLFVAISLLAGTYPAMVLSSFQPAKVLKGRTTSSDGNAGIRKGLVVLQFTISIALIVGSMVVDTQFQFMQDHALGFYSAQTLVIDYEGDAEVNKKYDVVQQELLSIPGVRSVTGSSKVPGDGNVGGWSMNFARLAGDTLRAELPLYIVDHSFMDQYHIGMVAGRAFSRAYPADTQESMLINETALKMLGFATPEEAIGTTVDMYPEAGKVIGVFQDFHFESLQKPIAPLAMRILPFGRRLFSVALETKSLQLTVAAIAKKWETLVPNRPLEYTFLDEKFNLQYASEVKFEQALRIFTALAMVIACLGLFGLALFGVQQRTKEIGIRKVLGASVASITSLLAYEFLKLIAIAILIASPIAWWAMQKWLADFAYRIDIQWWMFVLAGLAAILVASLTVGFQSVKAALANPVKSLRSE